MSLSYRREACVETLEQSLRAAQRGADRLELCADLAQDGLTPPLSLLRSVQQQVSIPIRVMIRPRPGNFVYTLEEVQAMRQSIEWCQRLGVEGVVFGCLRADGRLDPSLTQALIAWSRPLKVTFHRAIEQTPDLLVSVRQLVEHTEVDAVLTSGGTPTPQESLPQLRRLLNLMGGRELIVCGKVTGQNLPDLHRKLGARAYHGRCIME